MNIPNPSVLSISYSHPSVKSRAEAFANTYQLTCQALSKTQTELSLCYHETHVEIIDHKNKMSLEVDFISGSLGHRKKYGGGKGQMIAKAIGIKQGKPIPSVLDATAGLGKDSYVLACLGCPITLLERSPVVAELVKDAIARAELNTEFNDILSQGFTLHHCNALNYIEDIEEPNKPDVIYLDPMYPERKKSASVKKNMQILQQLLGHDEDTHEVLDAALQKAQKRVVVKRPKGAPELHTTKSPTLAYETKGTRYDVYICH